MRGARLLEGCWAFLCLVFAAQRAREDESELRQMILGTLSMAKASLSGS
jgi:hypothetical protein